MTFTDILNFTKKQQYTSEETGKGGFKQIAGLLKEKREYTSEEAYKEEILKWVDALIRIGIADDKSMDLKTSVESIFQKLNVGEIEINGRKLTKEEVIARLEVVKQEISALEEEKAEIQRKIASIKAKHGK